MARVTVEDCIEKVTNRFELVMLASQRARQLSSGAAETVERDNDKGPVIALREIAESTLELSELEDSLVRGLQKQIFFEDDFDEESEVQIEPRIASDAGDSSGEDDDGGEGEDGAAGDGAAED